MENLPQVENSEQETTKARRRRMAYYVAMGARLNNMPLFGLDGSGLYIENAQNQLMQV